MAHLNGRRPRVSREMRLLVLSIVVSGAVLLLLARVRFPEPPPAVNTSAPPLERIAARASFEELATRVARLEATIAPNLLVLRLASESGRESLQLTDLTAARAQVPTIDTRHVPALRIDATTAVAAVPAGSRIVGLVGARQPTETATIIADDPVRQVARIQVPEGPVRALPQLPLSGLQTPTYVVAVEGTRAGVTFRPIFLGRSDRFGSPRWRRPLLPLGGAFVTSGALFFTLDGEFLGYAIQDDGTLAIAGAGDVLEFVNALQTGSERLQDPGISLQALTPVLTAATGTSEGVIVSDVRPDGPAHGELEPFDVITQIDGHPATSPEWALLELSARMSTGEARLRIIRDGKPGVARLRGEGDHGARGNGLDARASLQTVQGVGSRIAGLTPHSSLLGAGLMEGDVIVRAGDLVAPSADQLISLLQREGGQPFVLVVFRRGDDQRVTGIHTKRAADDTGR
jgi:hypothetical protein